ncbi:hypothetical protein KR222_005347 [Zaprionus bogoriensis]|nr:hypothetical protein KR222_005347 [Zaprionus bogoriensis]
MGQNSSHRRTETSNLNCNNNNNEVETASASTVNTKSVLSRRAFGSKSTSLKQYPALVQQPSIQSKNELAILRDSLLRNGSIMRKNNNDSQCRPITFSELRTHGLAEIDTEDNKLTSADVSSTCNLMSITLPVSCSKKVEACPPSESITTSKNRKEFYIVGDGYHKTEYCYFRSPNGNFHKLPTDSFHKMSEGCFVRMPDGTFRRLENPGRPQQITRRASKIDDPSCTEINDNISGAKNIKRQLLKFIKRSKSHTPATLSMIKNDMEDTHFNRKQRLSNVIGQKSIELKTATGAKLSTPRNKIVVTMIENGGLPIVATSKAERPKCRDSTSVIAEKARTSRVCTS